jgi:cystinosin
VNDVVFALHALLLTGATLIQTKIYPSSPSTSFSRGFIIASFCGLVMVFIQIYLGNLLRLDLLYYLSSVKMMISVIKYVPQVVFNYKRKGTYGWSIENILLDLSGGLLSLLQTIIDAFALGDWTAITGNWVKFGMGISSLGFDIIFIIQHYCLYPHSKEEADPLLPSIQSMEEMVEDV